MIQIKWVDAWYDTPEDVPKQRIGPDLEVVPVAVVPVSELTKMGEGLSDGFTHAEELMCSHGMAGLTTQQRIGASIALEWVGQFLLAQLEGHTKGGGDE